MFRARAVFFQDLKTNSSLTNNKSPINHDDLSFQLHCVFTEVGQCHCHCCLKTRKLIIKIFTIMEFDKRIYAAFRISAFIFSKVN